MEPQRRQLKHDRNKKTFYEEQCIQDFLPKFRLQKDLNIYLLIPVCLVRARETTGLTPQKLLSLGAYKQNSWWRCRRKCSKIFRTTESRNKQVQRLVQAFYRADYLQKTLLDVLERKKFECDHLWAKVIQCDCFCWEYDYCNILSSSKLSFFLGSISTERVVEGRKDTFSLLKDIEVPKIMTKCFIEMYDRLYEFALWFTVAVFLSSQPSYGSLISWLLNDTSNSARVIYDWITVPYQYMLLIRLKLRTLLTWPVSERIPFKPMRIKTKLERFCVCWAIIYQRAQS